MPDEGSSNSHPLDPEKHYFLKLFDVGLRAESEAMWKDEWRHYVSIVRNQEIVSFGPSWLLIRISLFSYL